MSQQFAGRKRRYRGDDCKTAHISATSRVFVGDGATRNDVARDPTKRQHQASLRGGVVMFVPRPDKRCCNRQCLSRFPSADNTMVQQARAPLYDRNLDKKTRRDKYVLSIFIILLLFYYYFFMTGCVQTGKPYSVSRTTQFFNLCV